MTSVYTSWKLIWVLRFMTDETRLALYPKGVCMYYTGNITEEEVYLVQVQTYSDVCAWIFTVRC